MSNLKDNIKEALKEFKLTTLAIDNSTSVFLITTMIILFGLQTYQTTPKESFPEISFPQIFVNTVYFGNSAADMENLVTRPLEKELSTISEIDDLTSSSMQDFSIITAEFSTDVDLDDAARKVKDAVDRVKAELPDDLTQEPEVLEINLSEIPIMTVNISGNYSNDELLSFAEYLEDDIEGLSEISDVDIKGARDREVSIEVDLQRMESMEVSFSDINNAIQSENLTMSGGEIIRNGTRRNIRIVGEFQTVEELSQIIVKSEKQNPVVLRDIAKVYFGYEDPKSIARADQYPVVSLDIIKRSGENLLSASDKIQELVNKAKKEAFPEDLIVSIFNDQSVQTRDTVANLENGIISGVILVVLILLFFLGLRNASFVGFAIPLSMLLGIMVIGLLGYSMNMVVLFGLILALGMLVDNAIVVVENIYRYMQEGYSAKEAAKYGTGEVAVPIIASTATTLAAFVPLAFWPGLMGEFMKYMPITLIIVLSSSLFVALVINPVIASTFMKVEEKETAETSKRRIKNVLIGALIMFILAVLGQLAGVMWLRNLMGTAMVIALLNLFILRPTSIFFQNTLLPILERFYDKFVRWALKGIRPTLIFIGTFVLLIFSIMLMGVFTPKVILFPDPDPNYVNAFVELPVNADIKVTDSIMVELEAKITEKMKPYDPIVDAILAQIGENTGDPNAGPAFGASPNKGRITVSFLPSQERDEYSTRDAMEAIREAVKGYPGVQIVVDKDAAGPPTGKPVNIEIQAENIDRLITEATNVKSYLDSKNVPGVEELKLDVSLGMQETEIHIDREAARRYGLSTYSISDAIRTAVFGKEVSKYKQGEDEYPIMLRSSDQSRYKIDQILNQKVTFRDPTNGRISQVPISAVTHLSYSSTYSAIPRKDQKRIITIYSNVLEGYNPNEIVDELKGYLNDYEFPQGITWKFTGEQEKMAEEMAFLSTALLVAIFVIFLILVAQFNSIISPFIIIISVLFSTIGVFLGYIVNGLDMVIVMTGVGIISLAGIVVNNAIVLIDYTNLAIRRKYLAKGLKKSTQLSKEEIKEGIVEGGATRLRPVLLTAITTVLGLFPLAFGFNFDFAGYITDLNPNIFIGGDSAIMWGPMAWTVIYGLMFATFLTLVVVPVMYWLAFRLKMLFARNK